MSFEADITAVIAAIAPGGVHWDTLPDDMQPGEVPCVIVSIQGGESSFYVDQDTPRSHRVERVRFMVWGKRRESVNALARLIEDTIATGSMVANPYGAFQSLYSGEWKLRGTMQDFRFVYPAA